MNISNEDLDKIMEPIENYLWGKINHEEIEEWEANLEKASLDNKGIH